MATLVILNPVSGRGRAAKARNRVARGMKDTGLPFELVETTGPGHAVGLAREAVGRGVTRVICAGGDGLVHEVANGLLHVPPADDGATRAALGVIPLGTGNDYAKLLGVYGLPPETAAARLAGAREERHDVGRAWDEYFDNIFGCGFDAEVVRRANRIRRIKGIAVYLVAIYQTFVRFRPPVFEVHSEEHRETGRMMMLAVDIGVCGGGGFYLTPQADPMDGALDVCLIRRVSLPTFLSAVPRVMKGTHGDLDEVTMFRSRAVTIRSQDGPLYAQLDGELREPGLTEVTVTIEPARLRVLVAR
jgi:YegS/Rv2252/BmrU family lipid kinase